MRPAERQETRLPPYKKRRRARDSFRLTGTIRRHGNTVTLPRLGTIATHEPTTKLARRITAGTARILSATVSRTAHRWHVSFTVAEDRGIPVRHARPGTVIGIDLGIKALITGADDAGTVIAVPGPRPLKAALHKATTMLAGRYETVVAEDLNVARMTRNRRLARAVGDQCFGTLRRLLGYKSAWRGGTLLTADRFYPSSKKCPGCGAVKAKLPLAERVYRCERCGLIIDRDVNAARNLLKLAGSGPESRNACGGTVRPRPARHVPLKQEPGAAPAGKTGTAFPQGEAAA